MHARLRRRIRSPLFVEGCRIASRSVEQKPSNLSVRQNRLKAVLACLGFEYGRRPNSADLIKRSLSTHTRRWLVFGSRHRVEGLLRRRRKTKRTFTVQGDLRKSGKRVSSIRVSIGNTSEISTRDARATAKEYWAQISRGQHPRPQQNGLSDSSENAENKAASADVTLKQAWQRYLEAHLVRKNRGEKTIAGYRDHVERIFAEWLDITLRELGADPVRVAKKHDDVTKENGPYIANGAMRTLRAIYNHARKTSKKLPSDNPADAVDWNDEKRRYTGMGPGDLKGWFSELAALGNPLRREFHLFTLLSGSRPAALQGIKPNHIDFRRRTL